MSVLIEQLQESGLFEAKSEEDLREWYLDVHVAASCVVDNVEGSNSLRPHLFHRELPNKVLTCDSNSSTRVKDRSGRRLR
jgi:hypothetical protein